jgi:hypothetical protein
MYSTYLVVGCLDILRVLQSDIVMRYKVERSPTIVQIALEDETNAPSNIAVQLHDSFLKSGALFTTGHTRGSVWTQCGFCVGFMACIVVEVRDRENIAPTLDNHEVSRVFILSNVELDVILPAHDETGTVTSHHVWITRTCTKLAYSLIKIGTSFTFQDEVDVAVTLPSYFNTRVEAHSDLVPEPNSLRGVYSRLRKALDDLHHVLNRWLI